MTSRRAHRLVGTAAAGAVLLGACGTRLPNDAFVGTASSSSPSGPPAVTAPGVTVGSITIGSIASLSNPFDARTFAGPLYGLRAFVDDVNRRGGINGRRLILRTCDDGGSSSQNVACVHRLVDSEHVFALVSSSILVYGGAAIVNDRGVPDIGAQPIDVAYTRYPHLWDVTGEDYPRDGTVGWKGWLHGGTEVYRYFKARAPDVPRRAGVVYYNQSSSERYGQAIVRGLRREGYSVTTAEVNFALPDYDSVVIKFRAAGVRYVFDALDRGGNTQLCVAMDHNRFTPEAKVTTTQNWEASIRDDYDDAPQCRNTIFATGGSRNYDDRSDASVAAFRTAMARLGFDTATTMSQWALEGWAGAQWFADAAASCGTALTRGCVEDFLGRSTPYDGHGLLVPRTFIRGTPDLDPHKACLNVVRWQDSANAGRGGWVSQVPDMTRNCFVVPSIAYRP